MQNSIANLPLEVLGGPKTNPREYASYKVDCLHFVMNHLTPHKAEPDPSNLLKTWQAAGELYDDNSVLQYSNTVKEKFGTWVFIALYLKNKHTIENTGACNTITSFFAAQRLQVELLRMVALDLIEREGRSATAEKVRQKYDIQHIPFDALYLDSTYFEPASNLLMWRWLCLITSCYDENVIKTILHHYIGNVFVSPQVVAEHLYTGPQIAFDDLLECYISRYERDFLVRYNIELFDEKEINPQTKTPDSAIFISQLINEKNQWPV